MLEPYRLTIGIGPDPNINWVSFVYTLTLSVGLLIFGRLTDVFGFVSVSSRASKVAMLQERTNSTQTPILPDRRNRLILAWVHCCRHGKDCTISYRWNGPDRSGWFSTTIILLCLQRTGADEVSLHSEQLDLLVDPPNLGLWCSYIQGVCSVYFSRMAVVCVLLASPYTVVDSNVTA